MENKYLPILKQWLDDEAWIIQSSQMVDPYIYQPDSGIYIACHGCEEHSTRHYKPNYHRDLKTRFEESGMRLYQIWEDWMIHSPSIVESMVRNWTRQSRYKIAARKCLLLPVDRKTIDDFLRHNHIQGPTPGKVLGYGLYHQDRLISLMTFSPKRGCTGCYQDKPQEGEWELLRFCSALDTNVVGGASKLLSHFIQNHHPRTIYSYASRDISSGDLYKRLGFERVPGITSSYWYIEPGIYKRYHRSTFTKASIVRKGWRDHVDPSWTERQVMEEERGYYRIYDSGQTKWVLHLSQDLPIS